MLIAITTYWRDGSNTVTERHGWKDALHLARARRQDPEVTCVSLDWAV